MVVCLSWSGCAPSPPSIRVPPYQDPSLEAQARLLQLARSEFRQGHSDAAMTLFRGLLDRHPRSPFLAEAQWGLARSYDQVGDLRSALAQYRLVVQTTRIEDIEQQARSRISELERLLSVKALSKGTRGLMLSSSRLPSGDDLEQWVHGLAQAGVTTLVLDAWVSRDADDGQDRHTSRGTSAPSGVYFRTDRAEVEQDLFGPLMAAARREGLAVFAAVTLRRMVWLTSQRGWNDRTYDPGKREYRSTSFSDLFHPAFQEYLIGLLTDLAAAGVDGILFRGDAPMGPADGLSIYGLQGFERDFAAPLEPGHWFRSSSESGDTDSRSSMDARFQRSARRPPPQFWRWSGWKAREQLRVLDRLRRALRATSPTVQFALELHRETVTEPLHALVQYGEDVLEAKHSGFDVYVLGLEFPSTSDAPQPIQPAAPTSVDGPAIAARMGELIGEPKRIWLSVPFPSGRTELSPERLKALWDPAVTTASIGLLYVGDALPLP